MLSLNDDDDPAIIYNYISFYYHLTLTLFIIGFTDHYY